MKVNHRPMGIVLRTTLVVLGGVLLAGVLCLATMGRIARNWETARQRATLETLMDVVAPSATAACYVDDAGLGTQVVQGLVGQRRLQAAFLRTDSALLAQAGECEVPSKQSVTTVFSRKLVSPFDPAQQVGELILVPRPGEIDEQGARTAAVLRNGLILLMIVLGAGLAIGVQLLIVLPIKSLSDRLHGLNPEASDPSEGHLECPLGHEGDEIGQLVDDVNNLVDRHRDGLKKEQELRGQLVMDKRKVQAVLDNAGTGIFVLRGDGTLEAWTPAFLDGLNLKQGPLAEGTPLAPLFEAAQEQVELLLAQCRLGGKSVTGTVRGWDRTSQQHHWLNLSLRPVGPDWIQGLLEPLDAHRPSAPTEEDLTSRDPVTGQLNRLGAERTIADRLANDTGGLGLMLVSLELEDAASDALSPSVWQEVLKQAAIRMKGPIRPTDAVARLSDNEFLVILGSLDDAKRALGLGQRMIGALGVPIRIEDEPQIQLNASIGVSLQDPGEEPSRRTILTRADLALKEARRAGPNHCRMLN